MEYIEEPLITEEYDAGYKAGYLDALADYLNDECTSAIIVEAREWAEKTERHAHR
jgi:hypothetical protein